MPTTLITGCSRGIGLEFARQYAADGWRVIATCRRPDAAADLNAVKGDVTVKKLDVTSDAEVDAMAKEVDGEALDLLINNAGIYGPRDATFGKLDEAAWLEVLQVNTIAPFRVLRAFADHVARSNESKVVTVTSRMGSVAGNTGGGSYIYRSSKAALNAVMKSAAIDLHERGIVVTVFHPGWVRTNMGGAGASISPEESVGGMRDKIALLSMQDTGRFFNYDGSEIPW